MIPVLKFALRYDVDDRVGQIALAVRGRDEALILTYPNSEGKVADFFSGGCYASGGASGG